MKSITLTSEQARLLAETPDEIPLVGPEGFVVGRATGLISKADLQAALARRREGGPTYTTKEVIERLERLKPHPPNRPLSDEEASKFLKTAQEQGWL